MHLKPLISLFKASKSKEDFQKRFVQFLELTQKKVSSVTDALVQAFSNKDRIDLSDEDLIRFARWYNQKAVKREIYSLLSPKDQEANADLKETTTTANVASYPVPIGMVRAQYPFSKKKKK